MKPEAYYLICFWWDLYSQCRPNNLLYLLYSTALGKCAFWLGNSFDVFVRGLHAHFCTFFSAEQNLGDAGPKVVLVMHSPLGSNNKLWFESDWRSYFFFLDPSYGVLRNFPNCGTIQYQTKQYENCPSPCDLGPYSRPQAHIFPTRTDWGRKTTRINYIVCQAFHAFVLCASACFS